MQYKTAGPALMDNETPITTGKCTRDSGFRIRCNAGANNRFSVSAEKLTVAVGQEVLRDGIVQVWDSVSLQADADRDGNLTLHILVLNPDWDEPLRIAEIRSRPKDQSCLVQLACNLDHVTP